MEHELFQSQLKPSVDGALISHIIESSSSGEHPHRTAAMELIVERSIQERRKRMVKKAKDITSQTDSTSQSKENCKTLTVPIQQAQPPAPQPQPPFQPPGFVARYLIRSPTKHEAPSGPSTLLNTAKKTEVTQPEEPRTDTKINQIPSEVLVELVCMSCGVKQQRRSLGSGLYCISCPRSSSVMRCVGCGTNRAENVKLCTHCHRKFR